jgi:hypothetical protein
MPRVLGIGYRRFFSSFVSAYSFSLLPMPKGSVIDDILGEACRERKLPSADADEDRRSATLVLSSDFLSCLILSDAEFLKRVGEKF